MEKIIISASYFGINMGDEAILDAILESLYSIKKNIKVVVLTWDRKNILKAHKDIFKKYNINISQEIGGLYQLREPLNYLPILCSFWHLLTCDHIIFGGGGLINEEGFFLKRYLLTLKIAKFFRKKIFVFAIGVNKLKNKLNRRQVARILNKSDFISVRDEESKINLIEAGINKDIEIVGDPAFLLETKNKTPSHKDLIKIGINLRPWFNRKSIHKSEEGEKMKNVEKNIAKLLIAIIQKINCEFYFFPFDKGKDSIIYENLFSLCEGKVKIFNYKNLDTPRDYLVEMRNMDLFIGMRLHSLIFSMLCNVFFFSISYTEKTRALIKSLDWLDYCIKIEDLSDINFNHDKLAEKIVKNITKKEILIISLGHKLEIMKEKAKKNIKLLNKFLYG